MKGRANITRQMLILAKLKGWCPSEASRQLGYARQTIIAACKRLGVELPQGVGGHNNRIQEPVPDSTRVKAWSCAPVAVARYLEQKGARA